jgi:hypothetical protein
VLSGRVCKFESRDLYSDLFAKWLVPENRPKIKDHSEIESLNLDVQGIFYGFIPPQIW